ncbi:HAMP domain-containing sensor histidine kinase [Angustibacter peucedani]
MSSDHLAVLAVAAACVVVVGAVGQLVVLRLSRRGLGQLLAAISCVSLLAVGVAVAADARVMFLSPHDSLVVVLTLSAATPLAVVLSVWLGRRVSRSAHALAASARSLGEGEPPRPTEVVSAELATVQEALLAADSGLRAARQTERAAEASRRELVAWVSHDLRTPLAGIRAMAEALEDGVLDDPGDYYKRLRVESDRLSEMVDTLFLLSRLHAGALVPRPQSMDVRDLVSDAVASIGPVAQARKVAVTGEAGSGLVAVVDPAQLSRALDNLLVNGVHHTPAGGEVQVRARRAGDALVLSVQDACGGIAEDEMARVFDLAWRGASARSTGPDGGGGLGLSVARGIVEAHGGTVQVENHGLGCRFDVVLPGALQPV